MEPFTAWMEEKLKIERKIIVCVSGFFIWILGLGSILSFNIWAETKFFGFNFLEGLDYLTNNVMLPLGGLLIALLIGWILPKHFLKENLKVKNSLFRPFYFCLRYISIGAILLIFLYSAFL